MKEHIISLPHHPKRVIILSLIIALVLGAFGYWYIAKSRSFSTEKNTFTDSNISIDSSPRNLTLGFLASGRIKSVSVKAGDTVKKDQVLATLDAGNVLGALEQAQAAYKGAQANYEKVINGATGPTIDVAKVAANNAKINLEHVTGQQNTLVANAERKLYSDNLIAEPDSKEQGGENPVISGDYNSTLQGDYSLAFKNINFSELKYGGLEKGTTEFSTLPKPLGTRGLLVAFPNGSSGHSISDSWTIHIPNKSGTNYTTNLNAYDSAIQNKNQAIASAQAALDQANASLASIVTAARPEDVATAQAQVQNAGGALQIAEAAYKNTVIVAPADGTVVRVSITPGQIAVPNAAAIEFTSNDSLN
ncbi:MAG TPA: biotin/lipoyl-binding protein [Candidatus Paceibacterota bacterium]|jgi:HlyD family secretion protein|nr:biotin/lipoyl-binding protein [Candidatus Paceibacterota bacterium]